MKIIDRTKPEPAPIDPEEEAKPLLIIDANVFIKHYDFQRLIQEYKVETTKDVISELRDPASKQRAKLNYKQYKVGRPSNESYVWVLDFAKKTGDFVSLSEADVGVIALAVDRIKERGQFEKLRSEPKQAIQFCRQLKKADDVEVKDGGAVDGEEEAAEGDEPLEQAEGTGEQIEVIDEVVDTEGVVRDGEGGETTETTTEEIQADQEAPERPVPEADPKQEAEVAEDPQEDNQEGGRQEGDPEEQEETEGQEGNPQDSQEAEHEEEVKTNIKLWQEGKDFEADSEEGWITKDNLNQLISSKVVSDPQAEEIGVSIMTSDFAMQNLILQIGIPLKSHDGMIIKRVKSYVLECYSCWNITRDTSKVFCPCCGNHTLLKVTCSFNADGSMVLYRKKNYQVRKRGRRYNIPNPTFGRVNNDLILYEDQLNNALMKKKRGKMKRFNDIQMKTAELAYSNGWGFEEVKKHNRKFREFEVGYGKGNPNSNQFWKKHASKKKRKGKKKR